MPEIEFTPAQAAEIAETLRAAGVPAAQIDAAVSRDAAGEPTLETAFEIAGDIPDIPFLDAAQAQEIAAALLASGVPQADIDAALKADGLETLGPDERTEDEVLFDKALGAGRPEQYRIDWYGRIPADMSPDAAAAANSEWQQWAADVGFPPNIGPAVVELAVDRGQWLKAQDEPTRALWLREQEVRIEQQAGGEDKVDAYLERAMEALVRGGDVLVQALTQSGGDL